MHSKTLLSLATVLSLMTMHSSVSANDADVIKDLEERLLLMEEELTDLRIKVNSGEGLAYSQGAFKTSVGGYFYGLANSQQLDNQEREDTSFNAFFYLRLKAEINERWHFHYGQALGKSDTRSDTFDRILDLYTEYKYVNNHYVSYGVHKTPLGYLGRALYPTAFNGDIPFFLANGLAGSTSGLATPSILNGVRLRGAFFPGNNQRISYDAMHGSYERFDPTTGDVSSSRPITDNTAIRVAWGLADQTLDIGLNYFKGREQQLIIANEQLGDLSIGGHRFEAYGIDIVASHGPFEIKYEFFETNEGNSINNNPLADNQFYYLEPLFHFTPKWSVFYRYEKVKTPAISPELLNASGPIAAGTALSAIPGIPAEAAFSSDLTGGEGLVRNVYGVRLDAWKNVTTDLSFSHTSQINQADTEIITFSLTASF